MGLFITGLILSGVVLAGVVGLFIFLIVRGDRIKNMGWPFYVIVFTLIAIGIAAIVFLITGGIQAFF